MTGLSGKVARLERGMCGPPPGPGDPPVEVWVPAHGRGDPPPGRYPGPHGVVTVVYVADDRPAHAVAAVNGLDAGRSVVDR